MYKPEIAQHSVQRALDWWDSPRFPVVSWAPSRFRQNGALSSRPLAANTQPLGCDQQSQAFLQDGLPLAGTKRGTYDHIADHHI